MDKKIIIMCKMFDMPSQILFVENNEVKRTLISTIDKLNEVVFNLLQARNTDITLCHIVDFKGSKLYSKGIAKKLQNYKLEKYSNYDLTINII